MQRWIMHIDMDAFYASIEQMDHPEWRGKPLVVGGQSDRGVVSAASYEVRKFGVHSAMPIFQARRLCPQAIFAPGRMWRYAELSREVMRILGQFSPLVEKASIDEAFLDATGLERLFGPVEELGRQIKEAVKAGTGLTCSVGIAPVKFLAKIASDLDKPDGLSILRPEDLPEFLKNLPLGRIPGLGKETLKKLAGLGITSIGQAQAYSEEFWVGRFGKWGKALYERCHGRDEREVEPFTPPKSESAEDTFEKDTNDPEILKTWLLRHAERVGASLRRMGYRGRTVTLKAKYADFTQVTRSHSLPEPTDSTRVIYELGARLLDELSPRQKLRLIGLGVSNLEDWSEARPAAEQKERAAEELTLPGLKLPSRKKEADTLLPPGLDAKKERALDQALDRMRDKFGKKVIVRGRLFEGKEE